MLRYAPHASTGNKEHYWANIDTGINIGGRSTKIINPDGDETEFAYDDETGNLEYTIDPTNYGSSQVTNEFGFVTSQTNALSHLTEYEYDELGRQTKQIRTRTLTASQGGGTEQIVTQTVYDALGRAVKQIDPFGNETTTTFNSVGKQASVTDVFGETTFFEYDARGNLTKTTYPDNSTEESRFDADGRRDWSEDRDDNVTSNGYDELDRLVRTVHSDGTLDPAGPVSVTVYDKMGRVKYQRGERHGINGLDAETEFDYLGNRQEVTDPFGHTTVQINDENGSLVKTIDANFHETEYQYDDAGRRTATIFPDNDMTTAEVVYDEAGRKIMEFDQARNETKFMYDQLGRLDSVVKYIVSDEDDSTKALITLYDYDEMGNLTAQTDAENRTTTMEYDRAGRMTKRILPDVPNQPRLEETFAYDIAGNRTSHTNFNGDEIEFEYDINNRLTRKIFPPSSGKPDDVYAYTAGGLRTQAGGPTDCQGATPCGGDLYEYDERSRLTKETKAAGNILEYQYDEAGNRTQLVVKPDDLSPPSSTTVFAFDKLNRLVTVDPDTAMSGDETRYTYDDVGNRESVTYPNETRAVYEYDPLNRLTRLTNRKAVGTVVPPVLTAGTMISEFVYTLGPAGNRIRVDETFENSGKNRVVHYQYDTLYRLTTEREHGPLDNETDRVVTYILDDVGNRLERVQDGVPDAPNGKKRIVETYHYDARDRLTQVDANVEDSVIAAKDGQPFWLAAHPRRAAVYAFTAFCGLALTASLAPLGWLGLRDRRRRRQVRHSSVAMFMSVCMLMGPEQVHALGNETAAAYAMSAAGIGSLPAPQTTYDYDNNGNLIERDDGTNQDTFVYGAENRLISATINIDSTSTSSYTYDADGVRNSKTVDSIVSNHITDKNRTYAQVLEEHDNTGAVHMRYLYGDDLISQTDDPDGAPTVRFFHYDGQLSTRQLTDNNTTPADIVATDYYKYDAFGAVIDSTGSTQNKYLYTGEQYDSELNNFYLRARYYNHSLGRFMSRDSFAGVQTSPISLHKYLYAHAEPIGNCDPSGMFTLPDTLAAGDLSAFLQTINTVNKVKKTLDKIRAVFDYVTVLKDIVKLLQGDLIRYANILVQGAAGNIGYLDAYGQALSPSKLIDASFDLLNNIPAITGHLISHSKKLIDIVKAYNSPKSAFVIYLPTPYPANFLHGIPPFSFGSLPRGSTRMPIYVSFGPRRAAGRLIGLGITPDPKRDTGLVGHQQFFRMDWHPGHTGVKGDTDLVKPWESAEWHYHVPK